MAQKIKTNDKNQEKRVENLSQILSSISKGIYFRGIDFYLPYFYKSCDQVLNHFSQDIDFWILNPMDVTQKFDTYMKELKSEWRSITSPIPPPHELFVGFETLLLPHASRKIHVSKIDLYHQAPHREVDYRTQDINDFVNSCKEALGNYKKIGEIIQKKVFEWSQKDYKIFIASASKILSQRLEQILNDNEINYELTHKDEYSWQHWIYQQESQRTITSYYSTQFKCEFKIH